MWVPPSNIGKSHQERAGRILGGCNPSVNGGLGVFPTHHRAQIDGELNCYFHNAVNLASKGWGAGGASS